VDQRLLKGPLAQGPNVGARGEDLVGAGDDDAVDLGVRVVALECGGELVHDLGRQGVSRLGPIDPAQRHRPVDRCPNERQALRGS
jgi:hypothetical protein